MRKLKIVTMAVACMVVAMTGCAASHKQAAAPLPSGVVGENLVTTTATVKEIDLKTRRVTLRRADRSLLKFTAGDEVRNLPQVKVGDEVNVTYYESLAYEVKKPGQAAPEASVSEGVARTKLGEKPGGVAGRVTTITATIAAIDKGAGTVTLRGPDGEDTTIKARNPDNLNRVSVGDLVDITYTEAFAVSVEAPGKK